MLSAPKKVLHMGYTWSQKVLPMRGKHEQVHSIGRVEIAREFKRESGKCYSTAVYRGVAVDPTALSAPNEQLFLLSGTLETPNSSK